MNSVCFYFQVHQPFRLANFSFFDRSPECAFFDEDLNGAIARKVADKCYLPANETMLRMIEAHHGAFKIAYSISGVALEQFEKYTPEVIDSFRRLVDTGCVELLSETFYHSLSALYSEQEFREQVQLHREHIRRLFGVTPGVFRNTELIYDDRIGRMVSDMGFDGVIAEGADDILGWRNPNFVYNVADRPTALLVKNYKLSDDIAFRFSNQGWGEFPLTAEKFSNWVHRYSGNGHLINLFMDYETFGEHQWESTGIFNFLEHLPSRVFDHPDWGFCTPSEAIAKYPSAGPLYYPRLTSWADEDRDITAWRGNEMQVRALDATYALSELVYATGDPVILDAFRKLQTSDHFYYMCTKWFADGDVHAYFSPYESPYDACIRFRNVLRDFARIVENAAPARLPDVDLTA